MSSHSVVVRPVRFTERLDQMRGVLETLGLQARVESEQGGWLDMVAGAGMVARDRLTVRPAPPPDSP
jgi:hypothetical protein